MHDVIREVIKASVEGENFADARLVSPFAAEAAAGSEARS
jgi:hypothetical protein